MDEEVLQESLVFKKYVQKLSPVELESKKKAILECGEEKQRVLYEGERKWCLSPFCPICEARRKPLDVIALINVGDYLSATNDVEFFAIEVSVHDIEPDKFATVTDEMVEAASRFITSSPYKKFFHAFVRRMHFGYQKEKGTYSIHLTSIGAVSAEIAKELPIEEMTHFTRKSWVKLYNNKEFPYKMTRMESFKEINDKALALLYAFSDYTVPPEHLLHSEDVFLTFVKAIAPIRLLTMSNDMNKLFKNQIQELNNSILMQTNGLLRNINPLLYRNRIQ